MNNFTLSLGVFAVKNVSSFGGVVFVVRTGVGCYNFGGDTAYFGGKIS